MELHQILRMNAGDGETSYAKNSFHEKLVLLKVKPTLEKCLEELMNSFSSVPDCVKVADLGCCSGPNTYLTLQQIIESIDKACSQDTNQEPPTIQVFLNDLVANDFNTVFMSLPSFYEKLEKNNGRKYGSCLIAAMPGSFYGRLFPEHSMHFFHSSYSLHWLSQVPKGLVTESGISLNKGCIYIAKSSPPSVHEAYLDQFTHDFTMFLRMRSQEMVPQGQMIATFLCQSHDDDDGLTTVVDLLDMAIKDLVIEGLVEKEKLDSFNLPNYKPSAEEVKKIIEEEGSFKILGLETFKLHHDESFPGDHKKQGVKYEEDVHVRAAYVATFVRAVFEPILGNHFGQAIIPDLFHRFTKNTAKVLPTGKGMLNNMILSLARK